MPDDDAQTVSMPDVVPVLLTQAPVSTDNGDFRAQLNVLGAPASNLAVQYLEADEAFINTEAATALGITAGDWIRLVSPEARLRVRAVTRPRDCSSSRIESGYMHIRWNQQSSHGT